MIGKIKGYTEEERQEIKKTINDWLEEQFVKYDEKFFIMNVKWAMETRKFPLVTVLSVITGCRFFGPNLSENNEIQDFLEFVLGSKYSSLWLNKMMEKCRSYLLEQFPQFATPEYEMEIVKLKELIDATERELCRKIKDDWVAKQTVKYGETLAVKTIPVN